MRVISKIRVARLGCVAVMAALPAAAMAQGQPAGGTVELETITVEGKGQGESATGPVTGYVPKATTTGSKADMPVTRVPQSVSVVGRQQLEDRAVTKVDEALAYTPGVQSAPYGRDVRWNWFMIRGVQSEARGMFLDGMPLWQYGFGGFYVDPYLLERVEVVKGPASALYGGASVGGFVNMVSKRPTMTSAREVITGIDSWGNKFAGFDLNGTAWDGAVGYRLVGKLSGGGWETDKAEDIRGVIAPSFTWRNETTSLTLLTSYAKFDGMHTGGFLPYVGTVAKASYGRIPRDFFYGDRKLDYTRSEQAMIGYEFKHDFGNGLGFRQLLRYARVDAAEGGPYPYGYATPTSLFRIGFGVNSLVNLFTVDNQLTKTFETGPISHSLLAGVDYKDYDIRHRQWTYQATPIDILKPNYTGGRLGPNQVYLNEDLSMKQAGVYLQDQMRLGGLVLTLNGRYDRVDTHVWDGPTAYTTLSSTQNRRDGAFSGRAGLGYEFANGVTPYVSYTSAFDSVVGTDAVGRLFKPEEGKQFEVGVKYRPTFFDGLFTAAYFDMTRSNVAVPVVTNPFAQVQIGEVSYKGVELEAQANLGHGFRVLGGATFMDIAVTRDDNPVLVGKTPVLAAERMASAWIDYKLQPEALLGWSVGAGLRHVGRSFADAANTLDVPAHTVADAAIRFEKANWSAALNVANAFDKRYVAGCSSALVCNYGEGRKFTLRASYKW